MKCRTIARKYVTAVDWKICSPTVETEIPNESRRRRQQLRMDSAPNRIFWTRPIIALAHRSRANGAWTGSLTRPSYPSSNTGRSTGRGVTLFENTRHEILLWNVEGKSFKFAFDVYNVYLNHSILWVETGGVGGVVLILQPVHLKYLSFSTFTVSGLPPPIVFRWLSLGERWGIAGKRAPRRRVNTFAKRLVVNVLFVLFWTVKNGKVRSITEMHVVNNTCVVVDTQNYRENIEKIENNESKFSENPFFTFVRSTQKINTIKPTCGSIFGKGPGTIDVRPTLMDDTPSRNVFFN